MSKNGNNVKMTEFQFPQPKAKVSFCQFLYDKEEGTIFGRTPESWGRIILFYIIFYIVLAGLFTICLQGLYSTLNLKEPKWKLDDSLIGTNPGLGFRPISSRTERGSVIQFDTKKPAEGQFWQNLLDEFLEPYRITGRKEKFCNFNKTVSDHQVCAVDMSQFGPCSPENGYGYKNGRPCIFLKLNKIFNWVPDYYDDPTDLPENMPQDLKDSIASKSVEERKQVWVTCNGLNNVDREKVGRMQYFPSQGFPSYFYPFVNQDDYLSPLIAVQFENVKINDFVSIECRAWAKNIEYSGSNRDRKGSVTFVLYID